MYELLAGWALVLTAVLALRMVFWLIRKAVSLALPHLPDRLRCWVINRRLARARRRGQWKTNYDDYAANEGYYDNDYNPATGLPMMGPLVDAGGNAYGSSPDDYGHASKDY